MQAALGVSDRLCSCKSAAGRIRVLLLEPDSDLMRRIEHVIADDPSYAIMAAAQSWHECAPLLEEHLPELLVANAGQIPVSLKFGASEFPLVVRLREVSHNDQTALQHYFEDFRRELLQARHEIYLRKANQLSTLLDLYFVGLNRPTYVASVRVCQAESTLDIAVRDIRTIEASGNYVRIYDARQAHSLRETISGLHSMLDPSIFLRVHRSYIVNTSHIAHISPPDGAECIIRMNNGQVIPIGPNYRGELMQLAHAMNKLIA